jgi:hypothetical protein
MKIDKKIIQEKQKSEQLEKDKICLEWFNNQRFLTKDNRELLLNQLIELQQKETSNWNHLNSIDFRKHKKYTSMRDKMYFDIDLINTQIDKIKEVLINNKFK